jgi:hypothetical protein
MSAEIRGNAALTEDTPREIVFNEYGICGASIYLSGSYSTAKSTVAGMKTYPDLDYLKRKSAKITRMEAGMCTAVVIFEGVPPLSSGGAGGGAHPPKYSLKSTMTTSPIETHPKFNNFAGYWNDVKTWKHGAMFETKDADRGTFKGFKPMSATASSGGSGSGTAADQALWAGVKSYEEPGLIFEETTLYPTAPNSSGGGIAGGVGMAKLGLIDTPPNVSKYVSLDSKRNWLLVACDIEQIGFGIKVVKRWRLSGRNGWNPDIYASSTGQSS